MLDVGKDEAKKRRALTPQNPTTNPNPLKPEDFEDLLWPAHERYMKEKIAPLGARVKKLQGPTNVNGPSRGPWKHKPKHRPKYDIYIYIYIY